MGTRVGFKCVGVVKGTMNKVVVLCLLLLAAPVVSAATTIPDRGHVRDEYRIPYTVLVSGIGGGLFMGDTTVYVVYSPVLSDSDHDNETGWVRGSVSISAFGPGTNVVDPGAIPSISVESTTCLTNTVQHTSSGQDTGRTWASTNYEVTFDASSVDHAKCQTVFKVEQSGNIAYTLFIPVVFFNDDPSQSAFESVTALGGWEFLAFLSVIGLAVMFWSRSRDEIVQLFSGLLLVLMGAVGISLYADWIAWLGFGSSLVVLGAYFIIRSSMEWVAEAKAQR